MSLAVHIRPEAEMDLSEAQRWYAAQADGLGEDFLSEVNRTLESAAANPMLYPEMHRGVRRALTNRFPYGIFYLPERDRIVVLAVIHLARDPDRWKQRK